jgi:hypothetical protein
MKGAPPPRGTKPTETALSQCDQPGCAELQRSRHDRFCSRHRRVWQLELYDQDQWRSRAVAKEMTE